MRPALVVELGEVRGEGCVLERSAVEPSVETAERLGVRPPGVRADGGLREAAGGRRPAQTPVPALRRAPLTTSPLADRSGGPPHPRLVGGGADAPSAPKPVTPWQSTRLKGGGRRPARTRRRLRAGDGSAERPSPPAHPLGGRSPAQGGIQAAATVGRRDCRWPRRSRGRGQPRAPIMPFL